MVLWWAIVDVADTFPINSLLTEKHWVSKPPQSAPRKAPFSAICLVRKAAWAPKRVSSQGKGGFSASATKSPRNWPELPCGMDGHVLSYKNCKNGEPKCLENKFKNIKIWIRFGWAFSGNIDVGWTTNPQGPSRSHESTGSFLVPQTSILTCQCLIWEKNLALALEIVTYMDLDHWWICCCEIRTLLTSTSHHFTPFCDWRWL